MQASRKGTHPHTSSNPRQSLKFQCFQAFQTIPKNSIIGRVLCVTRTYHTHHIHPSHTRISPTHITHSHTHRAFATHPSPHIIHTQTRLSAFLTPFSYTLFSVSLHPKSPHSFWRFFSHFKPPKGFSGTFPPYSNPGKGKGIIGVRDT